MALRRFLVGVWQGKNIPKDWREVSFIAESAVSFYLDDQAWDAIHTIIEEVALHDTSVNQAESRIAEELALAEKRCPHKAKNTKTKRAA